MADCGQSIDKSWNSLVNYQMVISSAPNKHNNMYQSPLKGTVISLQSMTLQYERPLMKENNSFHMLYLCRKEYLEM